MRKAYSPGETVQPASECQASWSAPTVKVTVRRSPGARDTRWKPLSCSGLSG